MVAYDRTLLTKVIATGDASKFKIRSDDFLKNADIDFKLSTRADSVDVKAKTVTLSDGTTLVRSQITPNIFQSYDKLCIATGTSPIKPRVKGIDY